MPEDTKSQALAFLKGHAVGVVATLSGGGAPRARTVYYAADDMFNVFFCTLTGTRKIEDIEKDAAAAFVVSTEDAPKTLQIEGAVSDITETAVIDDTVRKLLDTLMEHGSYFAPLTHLDPGSVRFYKLAPFWVRFGDFTDGIGTDKTYFEIPL